ncbi:MULTISPECIES: GIY-YIG nuclease family protein [unclassified Vibrio]|uniref:GIY-YIG nuclease family protein n=1 Tax=unclassified Vibrio TaxID=2614977 RepID=UPI002557362B|nr:MULTISPECIES: GIY-YIG nuclease family protein [unclassified Vibrio]MDK9776557.1 GIY-YIG nuclease family protein [Vibrio sp. D401a]MDK9809015.1 GIY-YIG nuclease family protein [Vibrio sp. D406a]
MKLLNKEFVRVQGLKFDVLPSTGAVYIISSKCDGREFTPFYIGITQRLKARLKHHPILLEILSKKSSEGIEILYWSFSQSEVEEARNLEMALIRDYLPEFNKVHVDNYEKFNRKVNQLKEEEEKRSKQWFKSSIFASATLMVLLSGTYTFYVQDKRDSDIRSILEKEIFASNIEFKKETDLARNKLGELISELKLQQEALENIDVSKSSELDEVIPKEVAIINSKLATIESKIRDFERSGVVGKVTAIEETLDGSVENLLSVPLLKNDLKNYKLISDKELLRLEKSIDKLDSRLTFFVGTTITLTLAIFTAIVAPLFVSRYQRKQGSKIVEDDL